MPIDTPSLGTAKTGVTTSIKLSAKDAGKEAAAIVEAETQAVKNKKPEPGQIKYVTNGNPIFNCFTEARKKISFIGGAFYVDDNDVDVINTLEYHVKMGTISREET